MKTVVKKDIVNMVSEQTSFSKERVSKVVDSVFSSIREVMASADPEVRIEIRGFGVMGIKKAKAKPKARNPRTNEVIFVPPHKKTFFKPGKVLSEALQKPLKE